MKKGLGLKVVDFVVLDVGDDWLVCVVVYDD